MFELRGLGSMDAGVRSLCWNPAANRILLATAACEVRGRVVCCSACSVLFVWWGISMCLSALLLRSLGSRAIVSVGDGGFCY